VKSTGGAGPQAPDAQDVGHPATGCPFASRCPRVLPICRTAPLPRTVTAPQHEHWCHNPIPEQGAS
jgi:ABC-type dipeptide/oligopeptide/nickel transport system ATPase component